jgi:hypothetical protein
MALTAREIWNALRLKFLSNVHGILYIDSNGQIQALPVGSTGQVPTSNGSGLDPTMQTAGGATPAYRQSSNSQIGVPCPVNNGMFHAALGATITPAKTGKLLIVLSGRAVPTVAYGSSVDLTYGTGAAPANGAAETGTTICGTPTAPTGTGMFSLNYILTGLTVGTTYWIDPATAISGSTGTIYLDNLSLSIIEF